MSAGFGWSLSDVRLLAHYAGKINSALKEESGSAFQYQQATTTLSSLQIVLDQIQSGLKATDPSFRNALTAQVVSPTNSIASFNAKLKEKYGDRLDGHAPSARHRGIWPKVRWAFSAAEDLERFWMELSRRLEIVKLLILSETKVEVAKICSKVAENIVESRRAEQQLQSLQAELHQSRASFEGSITEVHRLCQVKDPNIREIQHAIAHLEADVHKKFAEDARARPEVAAALTDLASRIPLSSMRVEQDSVAAPGVVGEGSSKSDTVLATIQELHCLMKEIINRDERHESQYSEIQNRIDALQSTCRSWALEPAEQSNEERYMLWKSRNTMTRTLIGGIDNIGAALEESLSKFVKALQLCYNRLIAFSWNIQRGLRAAQLLASTPYYGIQRRFIRFEDFLGDVQWLDTSCFLHYQVLHALLTHKYKSGAAHNKIRRNEFIIHLAGNSAFAVTEMNWEDMLSRRAHLVMSATVAPSTSKKCPVCLKAFSETEQGAPYHCAKCFKICHFQEVTIPVKGLETSNYQAPAVVVPIDYSSRTDTQDFVDMDLNVFKNFLAVLHRNPQQYHSTSSQQPGVAYHIYNRYSTRATGTSCYNYGRPITSILPTEARIDPYHDYHAYRRSSHEVLTCDKCGDGFDHELGALYIVNGRYASDRTAQVQTSREYWGGQQGYMVNSHINNGGRTLRSPVQTRQAYWGGQQGYMVNSHINNGGRTLRSPVQTRQAYWGGQQGYSDYPSDVNNGRWTICRPCRDEGLYRRDSDVLYSQSPYYI